MYKVSRVVVGEKRFRRTHEYEVSTRVYRDGRCL